MVWTGTACAVLGAVVMVVYTRANYGFRRMGAGASWKGGWIVGGFGMTLKAAGWGLLAYAGPHYSLPYLQYSGGAVALLGILLYFRSAFHVGRLQPRKQFSLELHTAGIYRLIRHPQALALCLISVGCGLAILSRPALLGLPLLVGYWLAYTRLEESLDLIPAFGEKYLLYMQSTPRLIPSVRSAKAFIAQYRKKPPTAEPAEKISF